MNTETVSLILTTIIAVAGVGKAIAEARKARHEKEKAKIEAARADEAEKTTSAIISGVENAKKTIGKSNFAQIIEEEIQGVAIDSGVEEKLNKMVKNVRKTQKFGRLDLIAKLKESNDEE